jgi:anthranilate synthase component 1
MPVTILRRPSAVDIDPAVAFAALYGADRNAFWLDSGMHASSGMSYLGSSQTVREWGSWAELRAGTAEMAPPDDDEGDDGAPPRFGLGWVGWLSYELGTEDEELAGRAVPADAPKSVFLFVERALEYDHATGVTTLLAFDRPGAQEWMEETERRLAAAAGGHPTGVRAADVRASVRPASVSPAPATPAPATPAPATPAPATPRAATALHSRDRYAAMVDECKRLIESGEAYQLCLTNTFTVDVAGTPPDPLAVYGRLRESSPAHHGGFLRVGDTTMLSASPEQFLAVAGRTLTTRPIKGTRPRGAGPVDDALLARELEASQKERAENLMIVDLMRNDLSRVAELGSVEVPAFLQVESYPQVHQLVSTVRARLAEGRAAIDVVAAAFPAGSMTGAPKRSAMTHLARIEGAPRGIYSGAFGYLSLDGCVDLAVVIRTIVLTPGGASVGAGGGITALSDALDEVEESRLKARPLLEALGAVLPERQAHGIV